MEATLARIRKLSPAHQQDVYNTLSGKCSLKQRFHSPANEERSSLLEAFEKFAGWTIPAVFPEEETYGGEEIQYDYQSFLAQAVNSFTNKIVMALFHPSRPFFRGKLTPKQLEQYGISADQAAVQMSRIEQDSILKFAEVNGRTAVTQTMLQLVVTGNAMLVTLPGRQYRSISYRNYDAKFDVYGNLVDAVVREPLTVNVLDDDMAAAAGRMGKRPEDTVEVFTGIKRIKTVGDKQFYMVWQELEDYYMMHQSYGVYTQDTLPYKPQRWQAMEGRNAGIGPIEMMAGDCHQVSVLAETGIDLLALITDIKTFVNPQGITQINDVIEKPSGSVVAGRADDIHSHMHDVKNQVAFVDSQEAKVVRRLSEFFLMATSVTRDAERVTAEEIRYLANSLDQAHGGVYSQVARTLQYPIAKDLLKRLDNEFKDIEPLIVTGLEALSRQSELDNYRGFIGDLANATNVPPRLSAWLNEEKLIKKFASGWGVEAEAIMYTPDEKDANEKKQLQMLQAQSAAQNVN